MLLLLCAFALAIILLPERYVGLCFEGFAMWAECVLPSLFPFMIITLIFVKTGAVDKAALPLKPIMNKLNLPSIAAPCFLLSVCSGYPAGSRVVAEFCQGGYIGKNDATKLAYLCSTSGPLFIIGSVGYKMFGDKIIGVKMFFAHLLSVAIISVIISLFSKTPTNMPRLRRNSSGNMLYDTFYGAVVSVAVAGAFIAFFFVLSNFLRDFNLLLPFEYLLKTVFGEKTASAVSVGLIEATTGCRELGAIGGKTAAACASFLITFGGVSILLQQLCYLQKVGVKAFKFILVKLIQAGISFVFALILI